MRMVSRTPHALSCCTALFSSNLHEQKKIITTQSSLARAANYPPQSRDSSVKSQTDASEKTASKVVAVIKMENSMCEWGGDN